MAIHKTEVDFGGGWLPANMGPKLGMGIIAIKSIPRGQLILQDLAMVVDKTLESMGGSVQEYNAMLAEKLKSVPSKIFQHNFFDNKAGPEEKLGKFGAYFDPNSIPCLRHKKKPVRILTTMTSYINHSCLPNAQQSLIRAYDEDRGKIWIVEIHACRNIRSGEEITVAYQPMALDIEGRKARTKLLYGFECACRACVHPLPSLERNFAFFESKSKVISKEHWAMRPAESLKAAYWIYYGYTIHNLFDRRYCDLLALCARMCIFHSDIGRAWIFLKVAQAAFYLAEGTKSDGLAHLIDVEKTATSPLFLGHSDFGLSQQKDSGIIGKLDRAGCIIAFMLNVEDNGYQRLDEIKKERPGLPKHAPEHIKASLRTLPQAPPMLHYVETVEKERMKVTYSLVSG